MPAPQEHYAPLMQPPTTAHQPSSIEQLQHWLAHTVHWGDAPTWFAAVGGGIAAVYAIRTFRSQRDQLEELSSRQELSDQLLKYQAYLNAAEVINGLTVQIMGGGQEWHVQIKNGSSNAVKDVEVSISAPEHAFKLVDEATVQRFATGSWTGTGSVAAPATKLFDLPVGSGRIWTWKTEETPLPIGPVVSVSATDVIGGRWVFDGRGGSQLVSTTRREK